MTKPKAKSNRESRGSTSENSSGVSAEPKIKYGLQYPTHVNDVSIELDIYRYYDQRSRESKELLPRWHHFKNAVQALFGDDPENGKEGYVWHPWADIRCESFVNEEFQTWWGPASCAKSTDLAVFILTWWLSAPEKSTAIICTTSIDSLERRVFAEIVKYYLMYEGSLPGKYLKKPLPRILYGDKHPRAGIFGKAIQKGTVKDAAGDLIGVHNPYMILMIDEMQTARDTGDEAWQNLSAGCQEPKFLGAGNPDTTLDPLGRASEPVDGWNAVRRDMPPVWRSKQGLTLFFDGRKSPGVSDPRKYPFMLNQNDHDRTIRGPGKDSPTYWQQRIGFIAPEGISRTVMREVYNERFKVCVQAEMQTVLGRFAGLDSSFSDNGDRTIYVDADYGYFTDGTLGINIQNSVEVQLKVSTEELLTESLAKDVKEMIEARGIKVQDLGVDATTSQVALCDMIDRVCNGHCHRVDFATSPVGNQVSAEDRRPANEVYRNRVTELWFNCAQFAEHGQLRGLPHQAFVEFCQRQYSNVSAGSRLTQVEPKKDFRDRTKQSPDYADAVACLVDTIMRRYGFVPGVGGMHRKLSKGIDKLAREYDIDGDDDNYMKMEFNDAIA